MALRKSKIEILDKIITKAELDDYNYYWYWYDDEDWDYHDHYCDIHIFFILLYKNKDYFLIFKISPKVVRECSIGSMPKIWLILFCLRTSLE